MPTHERKNVRKEWKFECSTLQGEGDKAALHLMPPPAPDAAVVPAAATRK